MKFYRIWALFKKDLLWISSNKSILKQYSGSLFGFVVLFLSIFSGGISPYDFFLCAFLILFFYSGILFILEQHEKTFFQLLVTPLKALEFLIAKQGTSFILSIFVVLATVCINVLLYKQSYFLNPLVILNLFLIAAIISLMGFTTSLRTLNLLEKKGTASLYIPLALFSLLFLAYSKNGSPESLKIYTEPYKDFFAGLAGFGDSFFALNQKIYFLNPLSHLMTVFNENISWPALLWHTGFHISFFILISLFASSCINHVFGRVEKSFSAGNKKFWLIFLALSLLSAYISPFMSQEELKTKSPPETKKVSQMSVQDKKSILLDHFLIAKSLKNHFEK